MLQQEAVSAPGHESTLIEISDLVGLGIGSLAHSWPADSARLYAIDVAMAVVRHYGEHISEPARQALNRLQDARSVVYGDRDIELILIQADLETHLATSRSGEERMLWLTAIDALLPSPYRAALVSTRSALELGTTGAFGDVLTLLRTRLSTRLDEASWSRQP